MPDFEYETEDGLRLLCEYEIEEASGDGWEEPHVPRHASIYKVSLMPAPHINGKGYLEVPFFYIPGRLQDLIQDEADRQLED
jgi:hypothetical protein